VDLVIGVFGDSTDDNGILYSFLPGEEVHQTGQVPYKGALDLEVLVCAEREIFLSQSVFLEHVDRTVIRSYIAVNSTIMQK
jgi:hypothetical protein